MPLATVTPFPTTLHSFLRIKDVCSLTALSPSYIYGLQAKGQFPQSRKIAAKVSVWRAEDVQEWMAQQWEQAA